MPESKDCIECAASFIRPAGRSRAQWDRMCCCSARCANTVRARGRERRPGDLVRDKHDKQSYQLAWSQRNAMPKWAALWEQHRLAEELAALAYPPVTRGGPCCRISKRPKVRHFTGCWCPDCGVAVVADDGRYYGSSRCTACNTRRWRQTSSHRKRARHYGAIYEPVNRIAVFKADGWKCQLCGVPTLRKAGQQRSATLDHIVPLAVGGHHTLDNIQTACARCNFTKGANAANDQLRLAV